MPFKLELLLTSCHFPNLDEVVVGARSKFLSFRMSSNALNTVGVGLLDADDWLHLPLEQFVACFVLLHIFVGNISLKHTTWNPQGALQLCISI